MSAAASPAHAMRLLVCAGVLAVLAACSTAPKAPVSSPAPAGPAAPASGASPGRRLPALPAAGSGRGGYYQDDGPGEHPPEGLLELPDAVPKVEPYSATGNKPYVVFGKTYVPILDDRPFKQRGTGSWYGKKFHGQKTSSGELYDMYKLTAAHPTLPIPSYARVTNLGNGAQVIVRINDRGPFHSSRIIDLSYTAALKLGYLGKGSGELEVERLLPDDIARINAARQQAPVAAAPAAAPIVSIAPIAPVAAVVPPQEVPLPDPASAQISTAPAATPVASEMDLPAPAAVAPPATDSTSSADDTTTPAAGFYLQIGAYAESGNAEAARARLQSSWDSALPPLQVYFVGLFYRLHSGPFATREEAQQAAQKLQAQGGVKPLVVQH